MAPMVLENISELPSQHQDILLRIVTKVIGEGQSYEIDDEVAAKYRLMNMSRNQLLFLEFCLHTVLYQPYSESDGCPPGLSIAQTKRVTGKNPLNSDVLLLRKLGILKVLEVMEPAAELVYPIYMIASVDCHEPVVKRGEELLKKKASTANLDDQRLINKLFLLFNGTTSTENTASEFRVKPASIALKGKLMSLFCRSIAAANSFPSTLQCIFGCIYGTGTTSRLKQLGMEFTVWVFKHANSDQLKLMSPVILNGILKSLDSYSKSASDSTTRDTKTFAFQAIGLLAQRMPQLFRDKIDMAVRLFDALKMEVPSLRFVVQEATNSLAAAYKEAPTTVLKELEALLLKNSQEEEGEVRFCAVRWATKLFHLQHCPSRYICMLAAADSKLDIREMALEGLFGVKGEGRTIIQNHDVKYPKFEVMLDYILKQQPMLLCSTELREQQLLFPSQTYITMIKFLLECFEAELQQGDPSEASSTYRSSVETTCHFLEHAMAYEGSVELHSTAFKALITIGSYLPEVIAKHYALKVSWMKHFLGHIDFDTRESAARLLGIASSALTTSASSAVMEELLTSISGIHNLRFETQHGVLCAIGFVTADCVSKIPVIPQSVLEDTLKCLVSVVKSETAAISSVAMQALGHIGLRVPLPQLHSNSESVDVLMVLRDKLGKLLSGDDINAIQKILLSIGHICFKETSSTCLNVALDLIFHLHRCKVEDILFAAGEALSFLWGGIPVTADVILKTNYASLSSASNFLGGDVNSYLLKYKCNVAGVDETSDDFHAAVRDSIAKKLFDDLVYSTRKEERCAGAVWLVSLAMYCGNHPAIQKILPQIQEAFLNLLGEQNELVQELASQGMSIVYELGDSSMKTNLVNALVSTLTGSGKKKRAIKLVEDTEVFQEAIAESPSGGKLSTYKELCSLANEMGQPDLIYKFMDLANHQASLNSKRGAAFGFSKIAKHAEGALKPHLHSLIPRLVRYQYDPDKNVQDAMAHIWKSLVDDSKKTIDENLDLIITDLIIQSGSRLWRSREASCLALADIIQGRRLRQVEKHLEKLWSVAFRAMDDIKETVRNSGDKLCRAITSLTIRLCDVSLTDLADASKAMDTVLPFLLSKGMMSKVDSVRKASISIVMKLAKGAGSAIRPQLSDLVCCMLESLSSLEDQGLNYIELHAANVGVQTDKLENLRISIAKGSPMWETLDLCIKVVDDESLNSLIPRLAHLIRSGVGLNTRVGVANFVTLLVQKVGPDIKPYSSMLLRLLFPVVKEEKSVAAKRAFAAACAIVMKFSAQSQVQKLVEDSTSLHTGDRNDQISCAHLLKSYSSMASDVLSGYLVAVIPVIFVSRFEDDKHVSGLFEELWEENTSGERITLQLYLGEIVSLICNGLTSSSWTSKKKSAQAICKLCEVLGESISSYHHVMLQSLMKEVSGHIWEGKHTILDALGAISTACHKLISAADPAMPNAILDLVSSACSKKVKKFREAAFACLEQVIKAFGSPQFFNMVFPLLFKACKSADSGQAPLGGDATKTDSDDKGEISITREKILNCLTSSIQVANLDDVIEQQKNLLYLITTSLSNGFRWTVKTSTFLSINELCSRFHEVLQHGFQEKPKFDSTISFVLELSHSVSPLVVQCITTVKIAQVHINASECLLEIIKLYTDLPSVERTDIGIKAELLHLCEIEKNEVAKSLLKTCIEKLENLQQDKVQEG
ncbi:proteasome-associated protein ECM29 homolog isoform X2 [Momordica charantia]|nr:proteasome-associated protein ECM29 homolog isoform X2 [Momordica charantia]